MILNKFSLEGKSGLVTGGGSGIGKALAQGLVQAGADVVISGRNLDRLSEVATELALSGRQVIPVQYIEEINGLRMFNLT